MRGGGGGVAERVPVLLWSRQSMNKRSVSRTQRESFEYCRLGSRQGLSNRPLAGVFALPECGCLVLSIGGVRLFLLSLL